MSGKRRRRADDQGPAAGAGAETVPREPPHDPEATSVLPVGRFLLLLFAFAVWTGLVEEIPVFVAPLGGVVVRLSRDFVWMTPLADLLFFGLAGGGLFLLGLKWPALRSRPWALGVFAGLTTLALGLVLERLYPLAVLILAVGVGSVVKRRARFAARRRWALSVIAASGLALTLFLTARMVWQERSERAYWVSSLRPAAAEAPNILLLILDTVRGTSLDFLDGYGPMSEWPAVSPPSLDALARESVVFQRAVVPSPWTLPSHASMFTGRWPNRLSAGGAVSLNWMGALGPEFPTLAETLRRHGYFTAGFVGNLVFTSAETGLSRGFILYRDYTASPGQIILSSALGRRFAQMTSWRRLVGFHDTLNRKDAETVADEFLAWHRNREDRPYFAFLNFFDAHEPYFPPDSVKAAMPPGERWDDYTHFDGFLTGATAWRTDKWDMAPGEQAAHAAGYQEGILQADRAVGRILRILEERGDLGNTVVIVASDHGEQLGEHRLYNHNNSLYMPLLHVPLLIRDPREGLAPRRVDQVVSLRNMAATILDLAGLDIPVGIHGRSLTRYWREGGDSLQAPGSTDADTVFSVLNRGAVDQPWYPVGWGPTMYSLVDSVYHYVFNGDGSEELYDLTVDAREIHNLAGTPDATEAVDRFRDLLRRLASDLPPVREGPPDYPRPPGQ